MSCFYDLVDLDLLVGSVTLSKSFFFSGPFFFCL